MKKPSAIRFIFAKRMLKERQRELAEKIKLAYPKALPNEQSELKAIEDELWLLNNW